MNKFKVGDMVIAEKGEELGLYGIYDGNEYEITSILDPNENGGQTIEVRGDKGYATPFYSTRFVKSNKNMKTNEIPTGYYIDVAKNENLSEFFQKVLLAKGYKWNGGKTMVKPLSEVGVYIFVSRSAKYGDKIMLCSALGGTDYSTFHGINNMAKIMEFINGEEIKEPLVNGHYGKYKKGDEVIQFGCAQISLTLLADARNIFSITNYYGNRNVKSIVLDSGVHINKEQFVEIQSYIDKINAQ